MSFQEVLDKESPEEPAVAQEADKTLISAPSHLLKRKS